MSKILPILCGSEIIPINDIQNAVNVATTNMNANTDRPKSMGMYFKKYAADGAQTHISPIRVVKAKMVCFSFCHRLVYSSAGHMQIHIKH